MSRLLAVAARELRERWLLFPASLVFGLNPLVFPAFGLDRADMPIVGLASSVGLGLAAVVLMGTTMLARDAATGRLGFLFSRPLSWGTIWGGKWLAAVVLVATSGLLAGIPTMLVFPLSSLGGNHGDSWLRAVIHEPNWAIAFVLLLLGVGLANFGATAYRSRSPWLVLDMVLVAAAVWLVRRYVAPLFLFGAVPVVGGENALLLTLVPLIVGLVAGSAAQVAFGRTDVHRAHLALSIVFWSVVGLSLVAAAGWWQWVLSASPADVSVNTLVRDRDGRFIFVEGSARRGRFYPYGFLIDTTTGRWAARPAPDWTVLREHGLPLGVLFSSDGRFLATLTTDGRAAAVSLLDLTASPLRAERVVLESSPPPDWKTLIALSPSAASVFVAHESGASVFALPSGRRLATATIPPGWRPAAARYVGESAARVWLVPWNGITHGPAPRAELRVVEVAADGRTRADVLPLERPIDTPAVWRAVRAAPDGKRIVTLDAGLHLRDGATGHAIATLAESPGAATACFLSDGRVVVAQTLPAGGAPGARLGVFDRDGARTLDVPLETVGGALSVGPELAPGRVLITMQGRPFLAPDSLVVDVATGRMVERLSGLGLAPGVWFGPAASAPGDDAGSVQFLRDGEGHLLRYDFASGARAVVTGPGAARGERISVVW